MTTEPQTASPLALLDVIDGIVDDTHPEGDGCPLCGALDDLREAIEREARSGLDAGLRERIEAALPEALAAANALDGGADVADDWYGSEYVMVVANHVAAALSSGEAAPVDGLDALDGARLEYRECMKVRRLLGYLWMATGKSGDDPVYSLFDESDPIVEDVRRLAIFAREEADDDR